MRAKIAVCHIHKTAGTTISRYLRSNYPRESVFPVDGLDGLTHALIDRINDYSLIVGHFPLSFLRAFLDSEWQIVTVLRDPVARFVSHVTYSQELSPLGASSSLLTLLREDPAYVEAMSNFQTRFLGAWLSPNEWRFLVSSGQTRRYHLTDWWFRGGLGSALRIAVEEMRNIPFVLKSNELDAGMKHLAIACSLWPCEQLPVANRGSYHASHDVEESAGIQELALQCNQVDMQLMELAKPLCVLPPRDVEWSAYRKSWMLQFGDRRSVFIAADHQFLGTGWHEPEFNAEGVTFCWSDSTLDQSLYVPLNGSGDYEVLISIYVPGGRDDFSARLEWKGIIHSATTITLRKQWADCLFKIKLTPEDSAMPSRFTILTNCSPRPRVSGDLREVGYIFSGALVSLQDSPVLPLPPGQSSALQG